jgi:hypothetical protein
MLDQDMTQSIRWFQRRRMEWIMETLYVFGAINRRHLCRKFEISLPQESLDFRAFRRMNPGLMRYDASGRCWVAAGKLAEGDDA